MVDLKIYNNGENKILFSAGDRIIRQPYDFGKAFINNGELGNYIQIKGLDLPTPFSCLSWEYASQVPDNYESPIITIYDNLNNYYTLNRWLHNGLLRYDNIWKGSYGGGLSVINSPILGDRLLGFSHTESSVQLWYDNLQAPLYTGLTPFTIDRILLSAWNNIRITPNNVKSNRFILFNKVISNTERLYYYNNKLGSELQISVGVIVDLRKDFVEILDFSPAQDGSDMRVGYRDYSGNNFHGEIMQLPAGTLEEQKDFANQTLSVNYR